MSEKIKLYIIEDYLLTRISYVKYFERAEGFEILGNFATAEECIDAMKQKQSDIILVDLGLPKMNGIEATKFFKENYPSTKCIILTSHESEEEILASISCGAKGYLLKDTPLEKFSTILKAVHYGAYWFDEKIAHVPLQNIPKPNSTDFDNLYDNKAKDFQLTSREIEVLKLLIEGKTNPEIADALVVSINTAKAHVGNIIAKLEVTDRVQAVVKALQLNLV